jgi:hypothetical protein
MKEKKELSNIEEVDKVILEILEEKNEIKKIIVEVDKNPYWKGYGTIEIMSDGPEGYRSFKTHQKEPMQYLFNCKEYKSNEYELIIK